MTRINATFKTLVTPVIGVWLTLLSISVLAVNQPTPEAIAATSDAFELRPGVIIDPTGGGSAVIYMMGSDGGIDAVDSASGNLLWNSVSASKPLALYGHLLVSQIESAASPGTLDIALLDARSGQNVLTVPVTLVPGVSALLNDNMGASFRVNSSVRQGTLYVSWEYNREIVQGIVPTSVPGGIAPAAVTLMTKSGSVPTASATGPGSGSRPSRGRHEMGASSINLVTEKAQTISLTAMPSLPASVPASAGLGSLAAPALPSGSVYAATDTAANGDLILSRWNRDTGNALPDVNLMSGSRIVEWPLLTTPQSREVIHYAVSQRTNPGQWEEYTWTVFSLETGDQMGQIASHFSQAKIFLAGSVFVYESLPYGRRVGSAWIDSPLQLRGVDILGGAIIWQRPIRDTAYRGPLPR